MQKEGTIMNMHPFERTVDNLGRVVLPFELRQKLQLEEGDKIKVYINENNEIVLSKSGDQSCVFCGTHTESGILFKHQKICLDCLANLTDTK